MSLNKIIFIFGILVVLFGAMIFYQFNTKVDLMKTTGSVKIGTNTFDIEVVKNNKDQQIGLTKYNFMNNNHGMLFVFDKPDTYGFWMRNMKFPLDLLFINDNTVVYIVENAKPSLPNTEPTIYKPTTPVDKVLEINAGLVKKDNLKQGAKVQIELK